jgi:4-diphosphocytidyl-2-C-methyl-D-erythritol kinase
VSGDTPLGRPEPWPAPGKLNLCLHVVGRRADGYHLLQTAFQFIDLADQLRFFRRPPGVIELAGSLPGVADEANLALRAARLLAGRHRNLPGVAIAVDKRLPLQGGVGGGSSDAATVLVALNRLWGLGMASGALAEFGLAIGADVPVFVHGRAAWAEGVGERLTPARFEEQACLLVWPGAGAATAGIFQSPDLKRDSPTITLTDFLARGGRNDCEPVVRRRVPEVAAALDWLGRHGPARLTGTGSCVFAAMDAVKASALARQVPREWRAWVVHGLNRSPLAARLAAETVED